MEASNCPQVQFQGIRHPLLASARTLCKVHLHKCCQILRHIKLLKKGMLKLGRNLTGTHLVLVLDFFLITSSTECVSQEHPNILRMWSWLAFRPVLSLLKATENETGKNRIMLTLWLMLSREQNTYPGQKLLIDSYFIFWHWNSSWRFKLQHI